MDTNALRILILACALLAPPLTLAHVPWGTPDTSCEPVANWTRHDYAIPGGGVLMPFDGSALVSDCDGDPSVPIASCLDVCESPECRAGVTLGGNRIFCAGLEATDGHNEFAWGGAVLAASSPGSDDCWGEPMHHDQLPFIRVTDAVLTAHGKPVPYMVGVDGLDNTPLATTWTGCGDGEIDLWTDCFDACSVTFPPGLDGAYHVHVAEGTMGHVWTTPPTECGDGVDNDGDLGTDDHNGMHAGPWGPTDPECTGFGDDDESA